MKTHKQTKQRDTSRVIYHRDGSVTYWSVYRQCWVTERNVPADELAAMPYTTRERLIRHTAPDWGY